MSTGSSHRPIDRCQPGVLPATSSISMRSSRHPTVWPESATCGMKYTALIATIRTITGQVAPNASNSGTSKTPRTATSTSNPAARLGSDATPCSRRTRRKVDLVANAAAPGEQRWMGLAGAREAFKPADALGVYLRLADAELETTGKAAYT